MSTKSKVAAALAVLTLATTVALPVSEAEAHGRRWGIAAGLFGAAVVGAVIAEAEANANAYPYREESYGYRRCRLEPVYDNAGYYIRTARMCSAY